MRENLLILGIVFFGSLSVLLFIQNRKILRERELKPPAPSTASITWYQEIPLPDLPPKVALIFCTDTSGCSACLFAEASDWQKWLDSDSSRAKASVQLVCASERPSRLKREFEAMGIRYPIHFDSSGVLKQLGIKQSPTVVFCDRGREVCRYLADVNDRKRTEEMQRRCAEFLMMK